MLLWLRVIRLVVLSILFQKYFGFSMAQDALRISKENYSLQEEVHSLSCSEVILLFSFCSTNLITIFFILFHRS